MLVIRRQSPITWATMWAMWPGWARISMNPIAASILSHRCTWCGSVFERPRSSADRFAGRPSFLSRIKPYGYFQMSALCFYRLPSRPLVSCFRFLGIYSGTNRRQSKPIRTTQSTRPRHQHVHIFSELRRFWAYLLALGSQNSGPFPFSVVVGLLSGWIIGKWTEYSTSDEFKPTQDLAEQAVTGPATLIIGGVADGMKSVWVPVIVVCIATLAAFACAIGDLTKLTRRPIFCPRPLWGRDCGRRNAQHPRNYLGHRCLWSDCG